MTTTESRCRGMWTKPPRGKHVVHECRLHDGHRGSCRCKCGGLGPTSHWWRRR